MPVVQGIAFAPVAQPVIHILCGYDQGYSYGQEPEFIRMKKLLGNQENEACHKDQYRCE